MTRQDIQALESHTRALFVALGYRDNSTRLHSARVKNLAIELGRLCALSDNEVAILGISASFHDIGKLGIPDSILAKTSSLDAAERELVKQHCLIGETIILATETEAAKPAASAIRHHHERFNGSGYPDRLAGEDIPIFSRIIGVADSYDAMAEKRPYHLRSRSHDEIMTVMHDETGEKHDPYLMRHFSRMIEQSSHKVA